jgi:hypothetical protein
MYLTHTCSVCGKDFERDSVPVENEICESCYEIGYRSPLRDDDLVTGTPVTEKKPFNLAIFFEWVKLVQRVIMVVLTTGLIYVMLQANVEMKGMKVEMNRIANLTAKALDIAEGTRLDIMKQIDEIQRDGLKLHFRIW